MKQGFRQAARVAVLALLALPLAGCGNFFIKTSSGGGSGTGNTGDYAYVSNSSSGTGLLAGYVLSGGTLAPMSPATFNLNFVPSALAIAKNNAFLYAASQNGGIFLYTIGSGGALTIANSSSPLTGGFVQAMDISADGNYLFTIDSTGSILTQFTVNATTGFLTSSVTYPLPVNATLGNQCSVVLPCGVKVAPSGAYVAVALGTSGDAIYPFSSGTINTAYIPVTPASSTGDYAVTIDSNNYVYFSRTGGVAVYSLSGTTATAVTGSPFATAPGPPRGIVLNSTGIYVFDADYNDGTVYGFGIGASGALTAVSPATVTAPPNVSALAVDNSGKYLLALGYDSTSGLTLYSIGSTGALTAVGTPVGTGTTTTIPALVAVTH